MTPAEHPAITPAAAVMEPTAVQLARMEGVLNQVAERVSDIRPRVDKHEEKLARHDSRIQSLEDGAAASKETAVALALALKDAKEATEATARNEEAKAKTAAAEAETKAALGWSPITKLFAVATGAMVLLTLYQNIIPG